MIKNLILLRKNHFYEIFGDVMFWEGKKSFIPGLIVYFYLIKILYTKISNYIWENIKFL